MLTLFNVAQVVNNIMPQSMGFQFGLENPETVYKRKNRWLFRIPGISADVGVLSTESLPPFRSARPAISFKEIEVQHLNETVYYPGKPEFKPINLTLYDIKCNRLGNSNPIFNWIERLYVPKEGRYDFVINIETLEQNGHLADIANLKLDAILELLDGCGECIEQWVFENCWPSSADFQDLEMGQTEILMVDVTLRYDRAYLVRCGYAQQVPLLQVPIPQQPEIFPPAFFIAPEVAAILPNPVQPPAFFVAPEVAAVLPNPLPEPAFFVAPPRAAVFIPPPG